MRRLPVALFMFTAAFAVAAPAVAQTNEGPSWGVQAGVGIGYGTIPEGSTREVEPTFNGGVFAVLPFSSRFSFQPELKYDSRTITVNGIPTEVGYISVPLLLRNDFLGIYLTQGVALNMVARASIFDVDFKDAINSPDIAILLGVGKRFDRVSVEGRWETGLRSFQKDIDATGVRLRTLTGVVSIYFK